jgi:hypothetical protein
MQVKPREQGRGSMKLIEMKKRNLYTGDDRYMM